MGRNFAGKKKQYIAVSIVIAVLVSAMAILIAFTQQQEESVLIDTNPLIQRPSSYTPAASTQAPSQQGGAAPEITVSPSTSNAQSQVMVEGAGFEPEEKVRVNNKRHSP